MSLFKVVMLGLNALFNMRLFECMNIIAVLHYKNSCIIFIMHYIIYYINSLSGRIF